MEPQQQQSQQQAVNEGDGGSGSSKGGFVCRQSSTRWTPTTDQIRILKDLYYNNGVRSPSAEQIQRISARLRQYGKIEGKNVFYWFQNHKARERQKKRFTAPPPSDHLHVPPPPMQPIIPPPATNWKPHDHHHQSININHNNISLAPGVSSASPSSDGVIASVGQMGMNYGYGSMTMEKSFRACSISSAAGGGGSTSGGGTGGGGSISHNFGSWVGVDPYSSPYFDKTKPCPLFDEEIMMDEEDQYQEVANSPEIETLPLFPMHGEDGHGFGNLKQPSSGNYYSDTGYYSGWYHRSNDGGASNSGSRTSLELSLNSYGHSTPEYYY